MFRSAITKTVLSAARPAASRAVQRPVLARAYHEKVISHYEQPRNIPFLRWARCQRATSTVGTGLVGAPACGDVMKLQIRVNADGIISDVKFKTFGCGSAIASSSYMTERIAKELCLPPVKLHCSMLAEDAIRSAIRDYRSKRSALSNPKHQAATGETVATAHPGQA
ncbi:FeS cluster assembly scaffold IscU [Mycena polygramma]|nr:FeS cluster assembly scaffold IscU [Mycena polygramma]